MKAFVTGSTGLLGSNLVNRLIEQGHEVKALARSREKAQKVLKHPRIEIVVGDMEDIPGFAAQMADCDVLFHVAAYFSEYYGVGDDHWSKLEMINVKGTITLLTEAEKRGVKKAIYVSSSGVIGLTASGQPADESTPPDAYAYQNLYFKSKVLAEQAIAEFLKTHTLPVVLILPTGIVGPQDTGPTNLGMGIINILEGKFPVIPPGGVSMVDARDIAQAMINAVEKGRSGERYIASNGYLTMAEFANYIGKAAGVHVPQTVAPYAVMILFARVSELLSRITGQAPMVGVNTLQAIHLKREVSAAKAMRELGVTFRPFEETFRDEVNWFIDNGYVKAPAVSARIPA